MITAIDARKLVEKSDAYLAPRLATVESEIKKQAELGKHEAWIDDSENSEIVPSYCNPPEPKRLTWRIISKLRENGFTCSYTQRGEDYIPRSMQDDDGKGPRHKTIALKVTW